MIKKKLVHLGVLIGALFISSCTTLDYVPDTGWSDNESDKGFYEDWFGEQLAAASEPVLENEQNLAPFSHRFRLLILPNNSPASIYRIDTAVSGAMSLTYTKLDGAGGYEPGDIAEQWTRELSANEAQAFNGARDEASLAKRKRQSDLYAANDIAGANPIVLCMHPPVFVFESLSPGGRSFVMRDICELGREPELEKLQTLVSSFSKQG